MKIKIINLILRGLTLGSKFLLSIYLVKFLSLEANGEYGIFVATVSLLTYILGMDFYSFNNREILQNNIADAGNKIKNQFILFFYIYLIVLPLLYFLGLFNFIGDEYLLLFYVILIFDHISTELYRLLVVFSKPIQANINLFLRTGIWILVLISAWHYNLNDLKNLESVFYFWMIGSVISVIYSIITLSTLKIKVPWREKINNKWNIVINEGSCPNLLVSDNYMNMYKDKNQKKDVKIFLKSKIESAQWFIEAIQSRNITMQNIVASIISKQDQYFNSDKKELKPMILKDIADDLNIDISTVSRATKEKYIQLPWGIKELKFFFSKGLPSTKGNISSKSIKEHISRLIEQENKLKPLGDSEIAERLNKKGITIARRTIAKYREELNYPVARLRKELK